VKPPFLIAQNWPSTSLFRVISYYPARQVAFRRGARGLARRTLRQILTRVRHDGCGGLVGKTELLTGVEGVSSWPVRRIVLMG